MKWFAITNREKSGNDFGDETERRGKIHFLNDETTSFPAQNKDLTLKYIGPSDNAAALTTFVDEVKAELKLRAAKLKDVDRKPALLIYTHGFNNNFEDALEDYSEIRRNFHKVIGASEFEEQCLPVLFSWPSAGKRSAYFDDRDEARASFRAIVNMVRILCDATNGLDDSVSNLCVIANSMGNFAMREGLEALTSSMHAPEGAVIDQFIMTAADVGNTSLEPQGRGSGITRFSSRVSVYFSPADSRLKQAKFVNRRRRLGRTLSSGYRNTPENVVFCDCREWANEDKLNEIFEQPPSVHSCYRHVPAILEDIFHTICGVDRAMIRGRKEVVMNKHYRLSSAK